MSKNTYDAAKFQVIERKWFGLTKKAGGDVAAGYTFGSTGADADHVARWYPKGPIKVLKAGYRVLATLATPATAIAAWTNVKIFKSNAAGTAKSTKLTSYTVKADTTNRPALWAIGASNTTMASSEVEAGRFITIQAATPTSENATAAAGTLGGTVAFFIDYRRHYDPSNEKWDT